MHRDGWSSHLLRGVMSARTRSDEGSSVTSWLVSTRPPRSSKCRTRASMRDCAPPCRIGQPFVCPAASIVKPTAAEAVVSNERTEWVETPAKRDRARSPAKWERRRGLKPTCNGEFSHGSLHVFKIKPGLSGFDTGLVKGLELIVRNSRKDLLLVAKQERRHSSDAMR
jgi:hypothetical protein